VKHALKVHLVALLVISKAPRSFSFKTIASSSALLAMLLPPITKTMCASNVTLTVDLA